MFSARKAENEQRLWAMCTLIDNAHVVMRSGVYETVCPIWPPHAAAAYFTEHSLVNVDMAMNNPTAPCMCCYTTL